MATIISTTFKDLAIAYGLLKSGRVECPVTLESGQEATHLYKGYGEYRLEKIEGEPERKKGFQGKWIASCPITSNQSIKIQD